MFVANASVLIDTYPCPCDELGMQYQSSQFEVLYIGLAATNLLFPLMFQLDSV